MVGHGNGNRAWTWWVLQATGWACLQVCFTVLLKGAGTRNGSPHRVAAVMWVMGLALACCGGHHAHSMLAVWCPKHAQESSPCAPPPTHTHTRNTQSGAWVRSVTRGPSTTQRQQQCACSFFQTTSVPQDSTCAVTLQLHQLPHQCLLLPLTARPPARPPASGACPALAPCCWCCWRCWGAAGPLTRALSSPSPSGTLPASSSSRVRVQITVDIHHGKARYSINGR
jgi:hypothetical protein